MENIKFKECNTVFAKDQKKYKELSAFRDEDGTVITCYKLSFKEIIKIIFTRKIWLGLMTFNKPLQPQLISANKDDLIENNK